MLEKLVFLFSIAVAYCSPLETPARTLWEPSDLCPTQHTHWLLPHEWDCTLFYYCEYGMKYIEPRQCAPGTEFSEQIRVCIHPISANCTLPGVPPTDPPTTTTQESTTQAPTTTTEAPTTTTTQAPTTTTQAPTTTTEAASTTTTQAPTTTTTQAPTTTTEASTTTQAPTTTTEAPTTTTTQAPTTTTQAPTTTTQAPSTTTQGSTTTTQVPTLPTPLPTECPADFDIHLLLPHEECNKFYFCVFGEKVERTCAPGTYFNPAIQVCDWPANVECANSPTHVPTNTTQSPFSTTSASTNPTAPPNECPDDWSINVHLPHESDCGKFYQCVHGNKVEMSCAPGTHFNQVLQVCDWPANAGCVIAPTQPAVTPTVTTQSPFSTTSASTNPTAPPNECSGDWSVNVHLPHESDCGKFYQCVHGNKVEMSCAPGTHFNPVLQVCDWPANAGCVIAPTQPAITVTTPSTYSTTPTPTNPTAPPNECSDDWSVNVHLPHESDCGKFYQCVHGNKVEMSCAPGTHFNPVLQVCDWPANAGCVIASTTTQAPTTSTQAPNTTTEAPTTTTQAPNTTTVAPTTTTQAPNTTTEAPTTATQAPNTTTVAPTTTTQAPNTTTEAPTTATQAPNTTTEAQTTTTQAPNTTTEAPTTTTQTTSEASSTTTQAPSTTTPTPTSTTQAPTTLPASNKCQEECNVRPWAHEDCDKFWSCNGESPVIGVCSEGLHFNPATYTCDFICNVNCIRNVQATFSHMGIKLFLPWEKLNGDLEKQIAELVQH